VQAQQARHYHLLCLHSRFGCSFNRSGFNSDRLDRCSHRSNNFLCNLDRGHGNFHGVHCNSSFCSHGNGSSGSHTSNSHFGSHIASGGSAT
jgi:hypothetical protein